MREFRPGQEERVNSYREQAQIFMKMAEQAGTDDLREAYLKIAIEWLKLAAEADKSVY